MLVLCQDSIAVELSNK